MNTIKAIPEEKVMSATADFMAWLSCHSDKNVHAVKSDETRLVAVIKTSKTTGIRFTLDSNWDGGMTLETEYLSV